MKILITLPLLVLAERPSKAERQAAWRAKQQRLREEAMQVNSWLMDDEVDEMYEIDNSNIVQADTLADTAQPVLSQFSGVLPPRNAAQAPLQVAVDIANQFIETSAEKADSLGLGAKPIWMIKNIFMGAIIEKLKKDDKKEVDSQSNSMVNDDSLQMMGALGDLGTGRNSGNNNGFLDLSAVWNYGCWCSFNEELLHGKGEPKNLVDEACKNLTMCARCNVIDNGDNCNPVETFYNAPLAKPGEELDVQKHCNRANRRSECRRSVCACETEFAAAIIRIFFESSEKFNTDFKHSNGFDRELECKSQTRSLSETSGNVMYSIGSANSPGRGSTGNSYDGEMKCCGDYPMRKPFFETPMRMCCATGTYNPGTHDCCDGEITDVGAC